MSPEDDSIDRRTLLQRSGAGAGLLGLSAFLLTHSAKAQDMSNGAYNFYVSDRVTRTSVSFRDQFRMQVAANLFVPKSLDRSAKAPAIVVGHPMGAVKEQSANLYATKMAERGFVAMAIDLPFWGGSEG